MKHLAGCTEIEITNEKDFSRIFHVYLTVYLKIQKDIYRVEETKNRAEKYKVYKNSSVIYITSSKKDLYKYLTDRNK